MQYAILLMQHAILTHNMQAPQYVVGDMQIGQTVHPLTALTNLTKLVCNGRLPMDPSMVAAVSGIKSLQVGVRGGQ
jgi:hypothetical protein